MRSSSLPYLLRTYTYVCSTNVDILSTCFRVITNGGDSVWNQSVSISVATGLGHPNYPGHLGHFLSGFHPYILIRMPDPDQK